jgi:hypothetical protein
MCLSKKIGACSFFFERTSRVLHLAQFFNRLNPLILTFWAFNFIKYLVHFLSLIFLCLSPILMNLLYQFYPYSQAQNWFSYKLFISLLQSK